MVRTLSAVALMALAGTALACDDGPRGKSASYAPDDGIPDKVASAPASTSAKDTVAPVAIAPEPVKKQQPAPKRQPKGKPLGS